MKDDKDMFMIMKMCHACHNFGQCYSTIDTFVKIYEIVHVSLVNQYVNRVSK